MKLSTLFLFFCFIFSCSSPTEKTFIQNTKISETEDTALTTDTFPFPQAWLGNWKGNLEIFKNNKVVQTVPMELEMLEIDTSENFIWAIIYGEDREAGRRPYELGIVDAGKGHFVVDEKNTIKLETYLFQNKLMSWYEVEGNQILSIYEKQGDKMVFEIIFGSSTPVSITGGQIVGGENIPTVNTFPIGGYQRAILSRIE